MIELTSKQLRHAANLKDKIHSLQSELNRLLGGTGGRGNLTAKPVRKKRRMSAAAKAKLSAKLKAAWARRKAAKQK